MVWKELCVYKQLINQLCELLKSVERVSSGVLYSGIYEVTLELSNMSKVSLLQLINITAPFVVNADFRFFTHV